MAKPKMYEQGKALMAPEDNEAQAMKEKNANVEEYENATKPTLIFSPGLSSPSPKDMLGNGAYGSRPGEQRMDTDGLAMAPPPVPNPREQLMGNAPTGMLSFHATGGKLDPDKVNVVGEDGPEEIIGDEVTPLDHTMPKGRSTAPEEKEEGAPADASGRVIPNPQHLKAKWDTEKPDLDQKAPMSMDNAAGESAGQSAQMQTMSNKPSPSIPKPVTSPKAEDAKAFVQGLPGTASSEDRDAAAVGQVVKSSSKAPMIQNGEMKSKFPTPAPESAPAPPDPNQVIADQHAKTMKAKLDAASKGDLVGMGAAIIAGNALPKPDAIPAPEQGGQVPDVNLGNGGADKPQLTGPGGQAIQPGQPANEEGYKQHLADLDNRILQASQVHTPEGKQELGYLQSEKAVLQKMNPKGSAFNKPGLLGKIEHGLGVAGNIAGGALIPGVIGNIPGSQANLEKQNEEGAANVEQGNKEALTQAQADKAEQPTPVKPTDQLAQQKLDAQTKLSQITQQLQDPKITPEQKAQLQQQAEQIYATQPEFRPRPEDQSKQAVGDQGAQQHAQQLDSIGQAAGYTPEQMAAQHKAFDIKPTDSAAIQEKKLAEAESVAKLDSSRRDRALAQTNAAEAKTEAKSDKEAKATDARMDKSYQYNRSRLDKFRKPVDDMNGRLSGMREEINANTPLADALVAPKLLSLMTGGQGTGLRMSEAEIARIVGGRSHWEDLRAAVDKWSLDPSKATSITPEQRKEIRQLLDVTGARLTRMTDIMDNANERLTNAATPEEHRKVVDEIQTRLSRAAAGKVRVQIPGHKPDDIPEDKVDVFRKDNPNGTVEED